MAVTCIFITVRSFRLTTAPRATRGVLDSVADRLYIVNLGSIVQLQRGDILGHEFCGVVDSVGARVKGLKQGQRAVASFQIACGDCMYCKKKMSSQCERTNANKTQTTMFGGRTGG